MVIYLIDGSLEGLLCAVFEFFERTPGKVLLKTIPEYQPDAFTEVLAIDNDRTKADRVWSGLQKKLPAEWLRRFYCTFLSELPGCHVVMFEFACYIFSSENGAQHNFGNPNVLRLSQIARMAEREKHRMEAFIRFKKTADGLFYCGIDPDFNVLPLIVNHFKNRYADQRWIIYDIRRRYGLYYDLETVAEVTFDLSPEKNWQTASAEHLDVEESAYAALWKTYFKSTNIAARKNTKLQVRHIPKRYWKYLTEIG
jgi:probable DNA metabolism protein